MIRLINILRFGFFAALIFLNPIVVAILVWRFHVDVPYWDQWDFIPDLDRMFTGHLDLSFLFRFHNEHRLFFPRIIMLILARFTHWSIGWELVVSYFISWSILLLLVKQIFRFYPQTRRIFLIWPVILFSLLTFSMNQLPNWFWGWLIQFFFGVLATMICLNLIVRIDLSWKTLMWSVFWGVLASYSFGNALILWPIGLLLLLLKYIIAQVRSIGHLIVWIGVSLLVNGFYIYGYTKPENHPSPGTILHYPVTYVKYVLVFLGSPVSGSHPLFWGGFGLVLWSVSLIYLYCRHRERIESLLLATGFGLFAIGSGMIIGIGRLGFGVWQAQSPRYVTIGNPLWFALVFLGVEIFRQYQIKIKSAASFLKIPRHRWIMVIGLGVIVIFVGFNSRFIENKIREGFRIDQVKARQVSLIESRRELMTLESDSLLARLYPDPEFIRKEVDVLRRHKLSIFRNKSGE